MDREENTILEQEVALEKPYHLKGGMVERKDGSLEKSKMFEIFDVPLDDYTDIVFSQPELRRIRMHLMNMKTGIQAMAPALCGGPKKCPFALRCPIVDRSITTPDGRIDMDKQNIKSFPLMRQCIFEREFLDFKRQQYAGEYDVNVDSPTELGMVDRLAALDLYEYRLVLVLAHGDEEGEGIDLMKSQSIGASPTGRELSRLEAHPAWGIREKIHKEREDILRAMVGTRHEKYKRDAALHGGTGQDPSSQYSSLRDRIKQLENEMIPDVEYKVIEKEDPPKGSE